MLNLRDVKIENGTGLMNLPIMSNASKGKDKGFGYKMYVGAAVVTGSATIDLSAIFAEIDAVFTSLEEATSTDIDAGTVISWTEPATGQVKLWVWKATNADTTTLIAGTAAASVRYMVIGR